MFIEKEGHNNLLIYFKDSEKKDSIFALSKNVPIIFDYSKFTKKARFGLDSNPTDLSNVSFQRS